MLGLWSMYDISENIATNRSNGWPFGCFTTLVDEIFISYIVLDFDGSIGTDIDGRFKGEYSISTGSDGVANFHFKYALSSRTF